MKKKELFVPLFSLICLFVVPSETQAGPLIPINPYTESRGADVLIGVKDAATADALNGKIYLFGGDTAADNFTNQIQVYDIATDTWRLDNGTLPYAYDSSGGRENAVIWGGKIYISPGLGPTQNNGWGQHSRIIEFDPVTETAVEKASFGANVWDVSPVAIGNYIYWLGAAGIGQEDKIWRYDPLTDTLNYMTNMAGIGRETSAINGSDGQAYAFGGAYMGWGRTDIDIYNPSTNTDILSPTSLPTPESGLFVWPGSDDLIYMMKPGYGGGSLPLWAYQTGTNILETSTYNYSFFNIGDMAQSYDPTTGKVYFFSGITGPTWDTQVRGTYILTPIPVPGSVVLGCIGTLIIGCLRRRRTL